MYIHNMYIHNMYIHTHIHMSSCICVCMYATTPNKDRRRHSPWFLPAKMIQYASRLRLVDCTAACSTAPGPSSKLESHHARLTVIWRMPPVDHVTVLFTRHNL